EHLCLYASIGNSGKGPKAASSGGWTTTLPPAVGRGAGGASADSQTSARSPGGNYTALVSALRRSFWRSAEPVGARISRHLLQCDFAKHQGSARRRHGSVRNRHDPNR